MIRTSLAFFTLLYAAGAATGAPAPRATLSSLFFEPNRGQAHPGVDFVLRGGNLPAYLAGGDAVLRAGAHPVRLTLAGASSAAGEGDGLLPGISSYFRGRDPAGWRTGIPQYRRVRYHGVYPGVDLVYHGDRGRLEYDFVLAPGADPARIRLRFSGARRTALDKEGGLVLATPGGAIRQQRPRVYQEHGGARHEIAARYRLTRNGEVGFTLGRYRPELPLVIDPVLLYGTWLGGSSYETAAAVQVDSAGNVYLAGSVATPDADANPFLSTRNSSSRQAALIKFSPATNTILYFIHLGGGGSDAANAVAIDSTGAAYLGGITTSTALPVVRAFQSQLKSGSANPSGFIAKVAADGKSLVYCSYLGGSYGATVNSVAVDSSGVAHVAGGTQSSDFPLVQAIQTNFGNGSQAFLSKVSASGESLLFSTYYGGTTFNSAVKVVLDAAGGTYLVGNTGSSDFPSTVAFPSGSKAAGAFAAKFSSAGKVVYSAVLGANNAIIARSAAVDSAGNLYVTGGTMASDFPLVSAPQARLAGRTNGFLSKLNAAGTALSYSTYLGGSGDDAFHEIAVDADNTATVVGSTTSPDFPSQDALHAYRGGSSAGADAVVVKFKTAGNALVYSTFLGGNGADVARSVALAGDGSAWVAGSTESTDFPVQSSFQTAAGGSGDMFLVRIAAGQAASFTSEGVVNAATLQAGAIAPGEVLTLFGAFPVASTSTGAAVAELAGIRVLFDGAAAPLLYVSPTQINLVTPFALAGKQSTAIQVEYGGVRSSAVSVGVTAASPGIFATASGQGQAAALNADASANSTTNPAARGSVVAFWATGAPPALDVRVLADGQEAEVLYAATAPGMVAGILQVNIRIPPGVRSGAVPLVLQAGSAQSREGVTIAVQ